MNYRKYAQTGLLTNSRIIISSLNWFGIEASLHEGVEGKLHTF
jgi:hypothetical protein